MKYDEESNIIVFSPDELTYSGKIYKFTWDYGNYDIWREAIKELEEIIKIKRIMAI